MPEPIVFYDIDSKIAKAARAWNPNCWKTRYTLNVKGIPYRTVWVEYPDIKAVCLKIGAAPAEKNPIDGSPLYTLPAIYDLNTRTAVSDSAAIARYLGRTYPATSRLIPAETDALHAALQTAFTQTFWRDGHASAIGVPSIAFLNEPSAAYLRRTREPLLGKLEELAPAGSSKRRKHWEGLRQIFGVYAGWLEADGSGKLFFSGEGDGRVVFADITVAAHLRWIRAVLSEESEEWQEILRGTRECGSGLWMRSRNMRRPMRVR